VIFVVLGCIHAIYTLADIFRARRLVPEDKSLIEAMRSCNVRITQGSTMWKAWLGFNFSQSPGAILFGTLCVLLGALRQAPHVPRPVFFVPILVGGNLSVSFPAILVSYPQLFIAVGTACFVGAWFLD